MYRTLRLVLRARQRPVLLRGSVVFGRLLFHLLQSALLLLLVLEVFYFRSHFFFAALKRVYSEVFVC